MLVIDSDLVAGIQALTSAQPPLFKVDHCITFELRCPPMKSTKGGMTMNALYCNVFVSTKSKEKVYINQNPIVTSSQLWHARFVG